ncbi:hypothetical protein CANARDRAFT_6882 [[Candida] arabinofermentans NRRL YB-2248]|uniref:Nascent polypeptide-associated complex subunit alpha n=1 Tax=[Candida] arabinofermentans NRRL YB-2248 TaxID=983967 RepID=A0A1E4T3S4_9ASCO|nr:hypothetical protein CANARDRAFT_6882 [[Candida] arabinofermentans NRRL YB-2248]
MSIEELPQDQIPEGSEVSILSKNEKKARDLIKKLGLKEIKGISRVTLKRKGNFILAIEKPEVYRSVAGTYVVFGEAKVEDLNKRYAEAMAAQQAAQAAAGVSQEGGAPKDPASITADLQAASLTEKKEEEEEEDVDAVVDESGLEASDIELVIQQADVSRAKAVKALREYNGDMVSAIMSLTE